MKNNFLSIEGITPLTKTQQKEISGGITPDYSKCKCECGDAIGPFYCFVMKCPQIHCDPEI